MMRPGVDTGLACGERGISGSAQRYGVTRDVKGSVGAERA